MKKPLAIQLEFDIRTVRRALALITGEAMTDEEIASKFFDREAVKVDTESMLGEGEAFQICAAFVGIIMADAQPKKKTMKSKFQKRLDQIEAEKRALRKPPIGCFFYCQRGDITGSQRCEKQCEVCKPDY